MTTNAKYAFIESFFDGLDEMVTLEYDDYLNDIIDSVDVYGLGFTLQYILNCFKRHNAVSEPFFNRASALFFKMYDLNPDDRELNIYELLDEYEEILLESGILTRLNKRFNGDNELEDSAPMPSSLMRKAKKEQSSSSSKPLSEKLESIAYMDAAPKPVMATSKATTKVTLKPSTTAAKATATAKSCPPGKEINPKTGRCINQCAPGETRNASGRCVKQTKRNLLKQGSEIKINKTFPYENGSKTKSKTKTRSKSRTNANSKTRSKSRS
jgi:hypothetical protein